MKHFDNNGDDYMGKKRLFPRQGYQCPENFLLNYDFEYQTWMYDVKFYARDGGWWTHPVEGVKVGEINEKDLVLMMKYKPVTDEILQQYISPLQSLRSLSTGERKDQTKSIKKSTVCK